MSRTFERFGANTMHRFYMGAEHIGDAIARGMNAPITRLTMEDAIRDARKKLADSGVDAVVVVEIVAVVYREDPPVEIDILKGE